MFAAIYTRFVEAKPFSTIYNPKILLYGFLSVLTFAIIVWLIPNKPVEHSIGLTIPTQADWVDYGTIFEQGEVGDWDYQLWGGFAGTVVKHSGTYYLYYQGASGYQIVPDETVTWRAIGVATSPDGVNFTKYVNNPILTWFPTPDGEEGATSGGATLNENGDVTMFYGANTAVSPTLVNADGRLATSVNGIDFTDLGIVLDHRDSSVWGSGDELFPIIAFQDNGQWFVYYIPNIPIHARKLGVVWGNAPDNLNNSSGVSSGGAVSTWGMGGYAKVGPDVYALFINDVTVPKTEVRTISLDAPDQASAPIETYQFDEVTQATILLDEDTNTWFMYYRGVGMYGLKLAPVGSPDTTPPTVPDNVAALPISDQEIELSWSPATDSETGIVLYHVYREGVQIATVKGWSYTDTGLVEQTDYSYEVSAVNYHGLEGPQSAPIVTTTLVDTTPAQIVSVNAGSNPNEVVIVFDEPVEKATADNVTDYYLINNVNVLSATLAADLRTVTLMTTNHTDDNYLLTVDGLHDRAETPNPIDPSSRMNYTYTGIDDLAGAWNFDAKICESGSILSVPSAIDTSNFGNYGQLLGPTSVAGQNGNGLNFDGLDDHIFIDGSFSLKNTTSNSHTFAAWVFSDSVPPATTANNTSYTILARDYTGLYYDEDQRFRAEIQQSDGTVVNVSSGVFNPNQWHHIVMTVNDVQKELHLFVDGQEVNGSPVNYIGSLADHDNAPYFIGTSEPLANRYEYRFSGNIDEVRIFSRSLSLAEINKLIAWVPDNSYSWVNCSNLPTTLKN